MAGGLYNANVGLGVFIPFLSWGLGVDLEGMFVLFNVRV